MLLKKTKIKNLNMLMKIHELNAKRYTKGKYDNLPPKKINEYSRSTIDIFLNFRNNLLSIRQRTEKIT